MTDPEPQWWTSLHSLLLPWPLLGWVTMYDWSLNSGACVYQASDLPLCDLGHSLSICPGCLGGNPVRAHTGT